MINGSKEASEQCQTYNEMTSQIYLNLKVTLYLISLNITLFSCSMPQISLNRGEPGVALKSLTMHPLREIQVWNYG